MPVELKLRRIERGQLVGRVLSHAWRASPPTAPPIESMEEIAPILIASGAGGLAWRRIRATDLREGPGARDLRDAYRAHALQAAVREAQIQRVLRLLADAGVEPILVKGWAVARLYPEPGLRPYGDIDLCLPPAQYPVAVEALRRPGSADGCVDLHAAFSSLDAQPWDELAGRSQTVALGTTTVRVLSPEDHLRLLCVHFLRHGAARALWLCDVALLLETVTADFDWDRCLGRDRRRSEWVKCVVTLAHRLLEARLGDTPLAGHRAPDLPRWLVDTVLREWGRVFQPRTPLAAYLRRPAGALQELRRHWPNPIEATINCGGPVNWLPRLPFQLADGFSRTTSFLLRLRQLQGNAATTSH